MHCLVRSCKNVCRVLARSEYLLQGEIKFFQHSCFKETSEISMCFEETNERVNLEQYFAKEANCLQI